MALFRVVVEEVTTREFENTIEALNPRHAQSKAEQDMRGSSEGVAGHPDWTEVVYTPTCRVVKVEEVK